MRIPIVDYDSLPWFKAKASSENGACVEVAHTHGHVATRDSKDPAGPVLLFTGPEWDAFIQAARAGHFDRPV